MNTTMERIDLNTHMKIVAVSLLGASLVLAVAISSRTTLGAGLRAAPTAVIQQDLARG